MLAETHFNFRWATPLPHLPLVAKWGSGRESLTHLSSKHQSTIPLSCLHFQTEVRFIQADQRLGNQISVPESPSQATSMPSSTDERDAPEQPSPSFNRLNGEDALPVLVSDLTI